MTLVNYAPRTIVRNRNHRRNRGFYRSNPYVNILHTDDAYIIELAVPGIPKDHIGLEVKDDQLIISTKKTETEGNENGHDYLRREYDYSSFNKVFNLTEEIDQNAIDANLNYGVLKITLQKKEEAKPVPPRNINIQ